MAPPLLFVSIAIMVLYSLMEPVIHLPEGRHAAYFILLTHMLRGDDTSDSQL